MCRYDVPQFARVVEAVGIELGLLERALSRLGGKDLPLLLGHIAPDDRVAQRVAVDAPDWLTILNDVVAGVASIEGRGTVQAESLAYWLSVEVSPE